MLYCVSHGRGRGGTSIAALGLFRNDFITLPASSLSLFFITRNCSIEVTSFLCTHASPRHLIRGIIYYLAESRYSPTRMHPQRHPDDISSAYCNLSLNLTPRIETECYFKLARITNSPSECFVVFSFILFTSHVVKDSFLRSLLLSQRNYACVSNKWDSYAKSLSRALVISSCIRCRRLLRMGLEFGFISCSLWAMNIQCGI